MPVGTRVTVYLPPPQIATLGPRAAHINDVIRAWGADPQKDLLRPHRHSQDNLRGNFGIPHSKMWFRRGGGAPAWNGHWLFHLLAAGLEHGQGSLGPVALAWGQDRLECREGHHSFPPLSPKTGCGAWRPPVGGSSLQVQHHLTKSLFSNATLPASSPLPSPPMSEG